MLYPKTSKPRPGLLVLVAVVGTVALHSAMAPHSESTGVGALIESVKEELETLEEDLEQYVDDMTHTDVFEKVLPGDEDEVELTTEGSESIAAVVADVQELEAAAEAGTAPTEEATNDLEADVEQLEEELKAGEIDVAEAEALEETVESTEESIEQVEETMEETGPEEGED